MNCLKEKKNNTNDIMQCKCVDFVAKNRFEFWTMLAECEYLNKKFTSNA